MGVPFSKEIRAVLVEVVPISNSALQAVQTVKWFTLLQLILQVATVFLLFFLLLALIAILFTLNKDFTEERKVLVDPVLRFIAKSLRSVKLV
jgi:hypothetical protein